MKECGYPIGLTPTPAKPSGSRSDQPVPQTYVDTIPPAVSGQNPTGEITYAIEIPNRDGRAAGLSNRVQVPAAPVFPPPSGLAAQLGPKGIVLTWAGEAEVPGGPYISHRYRVYRTEFDGKKEVVAGEVPLQEAGPVQFTDQSFEWEKSYGYRVEVVTTINRGTRPCPSTTTQESDCNDIREVEGDETDEVKVVAHDVFPPSTPSGLQAVYSGVGQQAFIDLTWAPVTDADLGGYNVYRREENSAPVKLNGELVRAPSYRDEHVAAGKTYWYSISAVDVRSNESAHSEETSETVP